LGKIASVSVKDNRTFRWPIMPRATGSWALVLLAGLLFCGVTAYAVIHLNDPPGSWRDPPIYPGAQAVTRDDTPDKGRGCPFECVYTRVSFTTSDGTEPVLAFYDSVFRRDGATPEPYATAPVEPSGVGYFWLKGKEVYVIRIFVDALAAGEMHIELRLDYYVGD
jgi:hypothetical protein